MPQMCPSCSHDNRDSAQYCAHCRAQLHNLLGSHTLLQSRYEVIRVLGCGGMAAVYLALDRRLGDNEVAVKENFDTSPEAQHQFHREATVLAKLDHPNLPKVIDHFIEFTGRQYLVMEYVGGDDLETIAEQRGPLLEADVLAWADKLLDALAYLHTRLPPIIHRDVKPSNIKITDEGKLKLVDFGLVKLFDASNPRTSTMLHGLGSPGYAPPEQYNIAGHTDQRSDIYALGASLYRLLTGIEPPEANLRAANPAALRPPRSINSKITPSTEAAILKAMQLPQVDRFQTAGEFRAALIAKAPFPTMVPPPMHIPTQYAPPISSSTFRLRSILIGVTLITIFVIAVSQFGQAFTVTPIPTPALSPSATPTDDATPTITPNPTDTPMATPTATSTNTRTPTNMPTESPTSTPTFTRTPRPIPTKIPTAKPTTAPTTTPSSVPFSVIFTAQPRTVSLGQCAVVHWEVHGVQAIQYEGQWEVWAGDRTVCPGSTTTYKLTVQLYSGAFEDYFVTITVK